MYWGEAAALATSICWSATAVCLSYGGRILGTAIVNLARLFFALLFLSAAHGILMGSLFPLDAELFRWGWFGISSLLGLVLGDCLLMALPPILLIPIDYLVYGKPISARGVTGTFMAIVGVGLLFLAG